VRLRRPTVCVVVAALGFAATGSAQETPDPEAALRQYRLAQRLGAERSPDAAAAFERVVALDPNGRLADDALVDLARLSGLPDWPEDVADLSSSRAVAAIGPLRQAVSAHVDGDRILEARYRLALIGLAPLAGRDAPGARQELIAVANNAAGGRWVDAARYALGVLDEQSGAIDRAAGAFARIVVEDSDGDVAPRARAGFGRTLLAGGKFGLAAGWFQEAIESGVPPGLRAAEQRDLAVRELVRERDPSRRWTAVTSPLASLATMHGAALLSNSMGGGFVLFDRKNEALLAFDGDGRGTRKVQLGGVTALSTDPFGRVFAATKDRVVRWDASGLTDVVALGPLGAPTAIAVDPSGTVWLADRKGDRVFRWDVGTPAPVLAWESSGAGVAALAIGRGRVIVAQQKTGRLLVVAGPGAGSIFGDAVFRRPVGLAVDSAGRTSVLDAKADTLTRLTVAGALSDTLSLEASGVSRPVSIAPAPNGAIWILDAASGSVVVTP
jgi:DNA-binding beta-propeller fold protein YncE